MLIRLVQHRLIVVLLAFLCVIWASDTSDPLPTLRFGQSVPLTGYDALDGILYRDGILTAFQEYNDDPRPDKRFRLELVVKDDVGDPPTAKNNVQQLVADPSIVGIIGLLGTTSTELASPVAFASGRPVIAPYGGVAYRHPFQRNMINLRASYFDEAAALVEYLHMEQNRDHIALFVQNGPLGVVTRDGVLAALDSRNIYLHSYTLYSKKGNESLWYAESIAALESMQSTTSSNGAQLPPDAIIIAADYEPASVFIPLARARFPDTILACLSRVSIKVLIDVVASQVGDASVLKGLYVSEVVPLPTKLAMRAVRRYQTASIGLTNWTFSGLEGYLMGILAIETLERIRGLSFTPELFLSALYETSYLNLVGIQVGPFLDAKAKAQDGYDGVESCNQGMRQVIVATVAENNTVSQAGTFAFDTCGYRTKQWDTLYFGQSCSFNDSLSSECADFRDGVLSVFRLVNDADGIRGTTRLKLTTRDDHGDKERALANNLAMLKDPSIFGLIGTSSNGLQELLDAHSEKFVIGVFDGDVSVRKPFRRNMINFRASIADEAFAIVHHCYNVLHLTKISVLYEATTYGEATLKHVVNALDEKRLRIHSQDAYTVTNASDAVAQLFRGRDSQLEVVVFIGMGDKFVDVVVDVHSRNRNVMVFGMSKTITTRLLLPENQVKVNWGRVMLTSCVPDVTNTSIDVVGQYLAALANLDNSLKPSSAGLEGYLAGQLLTTAMNSIIANHLSVENVLDSVYDHGIFKMSDLRCGPFLDNSSQLPACNQCMKQVYLLGFNGTENATHMLQPFTFDTCMYVPSVNLDFGLGGSRLIVVLVASMGAGYTVVIMMLLVRYRMNDHVRPISVRFALVSCVGALLCFGNVFVLYPIPTNLTCGLGPWLSDLAFVTLFGPIFAKAYRIDKLFNGKKLKRHVISDGQVFQIFVAILLCFVTFLVVYTVLDAPHMREAFTYTGVRFETCVTKHSVFVQIDYTLKGIVLVWGCFLCQRVSKVSGQFARFNESKEMVLCIYHTTFLALIVLLLGLTTVEAPNIKFLCVSTLVIENTVVVVTVLYTRRVLCAFQKREVVESSEISTDSNSRSNGKAAHSTPRSSDPQFTFARKAANDVDATRKSNELVAPGKTTGDHIVAPAKHAEVHAPPIQRNINNWIPGDSGLFERVQLDEAILED